MININSLKWSNRLKRCIGKLPTNCLSVLDHFVELALKWLISSASRLFHISFHLNVSLLVFLAILFFKMKDGNSKLPFFLKQKQILRK